MHAGSQGTGRGLGRDWDSGYENVSPAGGGGRRYVLIRLDWLLWGRIFNSATRMGSHIFGFFDCRSFRRGLGPPVTPAVLQATWRAGKPAKQTYFAVRSNWPRVGASHKMIPRDVPLRSTISWHAFTVLTIQGLKTKWSNLGNKNGTGKTKAVFNHGLASSFLEDSFLTKIMEYWTTLNHENNLDFTSCQIWYNSL